MKHVCLKLLLVLLSVSVNFPYARGSGENKDKQINRLSPKRLGSDWPFELYYRVFHYFSPSRVAGLRSVNKEFDKSTQNYLQSRIHSCDSTFSCLPLELSDSIFQFFDCNELKELRLVNKEFNEMINASSLWKKSALDLREHSRFTYYLKSPNSLINESSNRLRNVRFNVSFSLSASQMERFNTLFPKNRNIKIFATEDNNEFNIDSMSMKQLCQHNIDFNNDNLIYHLDFFGWSRIFYGAQYAHRVLESSERFEHNLYFDKISPLTYFESGCQTSFKYNFSPLTQIPPFVFPETHNYLITLRNLKAINDHFNKKAQSIINPPQAEIIFDIKPDPVKAAIIKSKVIDFYKKN